MSEESGAEDDGPASDAGLEMLVLGSGDEDEDEDGASADEAAEDQVADAASAPERAAINVQDSDKETLVMGECSQAEMDPEEPAEGECSQGEMDPDEPAEGSQKIQDACLVRGVCEADCKCAACVAGKMASYATGFLIHKHEWLDTHPLCQDYVDHCYDVFLHNGPCAAKWLTTIEYFFEWKRLRTGAPQGVPVQQPSSSSKERGFEVRLRVHD